MAMTQLALAASRVLAPPVRTVPRLREKLHGGDAIEPQVPVPPRAVCAVHRRCCRKPGGARGFFRGCEERRRHVDMLVDVARSRRLGFLSDDDRRPQESGREHDPADDPTQVSRPRQYGP
jgi:hypothetical protein